MPKCDLVIVSTPSFFLGLTALILRNMSSIEFILDIRDLYPASIHQAGMLQDGQILRLLQRIEQKVYQQAKIVSVVNPDWTNHIKLHAEKVVSVPNGVDLLTFLGVNELPANFTSEQEDLLNKYLAIVYVGNLGTFYDFTPFLQAAKVLAADGDQRFKFIFIGEGTQRPKLEHEVKSGGLRNVHFWQPVPNEFLAAILKRCLVGVAAWRTNVEFLKNSVPNKIYEYLAADLDVIACLPGALPDYLTKSNKVFALEISDVAGILDRLKKIASITKRKKTPDNVLRLISREHHFDLLWNQISNEPSNPNALAETFHKVNATDLN